MPDKHERVSRFRTGWCSLCHGVTYHSAPWPMTESLKDPVKWCGCTTAELIEAGHMQPSRGK